MSNLIPTRKDDNWNDGTTTIWFEDVSTNDGESVDNPAILGSILEAARAAVVNL